MKFKDWDGKDLKGTWMFTFKVDGVRVEKHNGEKLSRSGKPLFNIPDFEGNVAEVFCGSWNETVSRVRTSSKKLIISSSQIYKLMPQIDKRLIILKSVKDPTANFIESHKSRAEALGFEGLVLRRLDKEQAFIKVKESYTQDTKIIGFVEGKGKFKGMLGKFLTENGGVGIGYRNAAPEERLTTERRKELWKKRKELLGTYIEVMCMYMTDKNMFFQPRLVRLRPDKS